MPIAWRIVKTKRAGTAFDGEGARRDGGRWNSQGTYMVYTGGTISIAMLEVLVHLEDSELLPSYSLLSAEWDDPNLVADVNQSSFPADWRDPIPSVALQQVGDAWIKSQNSVILRVPSVIVPRESNYLINPKHPDFPRLRISEPEPFSFDPRLFSK